MANQLTTQERDRDKADDVALDHGYLLGRSYVLVDRLKCLRIGVFCNDCDSSIKYLRYHLKEASHRSSVIGLSQGRQLLDDVETALESHLTPGESRRADP